MDLSVLKLVDDFLHGRLGAMTYKYLVLHVGANPRYESSWDPQFCRISRRLVSLAT